MYIERISISFQSTENKQQHGPKIAGTEVRKHYGDDTNMCLVKSCYEWTYRTRAYYGSSRSVSLPLEGGFNQLNAVRVVCVNADINRQKYIYKKGTIHVTSIFFYWHMPKINLLL